MRRQRLFVIAIVTAMITLSAAGVFAAGPIQISPPNVAPSVNKPIEFIWNLYPMTAFYQLEVDNDITFLTPAVDTSIMSLTDTTCTISALNYGTNYYWRVRSYYFNGMGFVYTDWSSIWMFTVRSQVPQLLSPVNDATDVGTPPVLDWLEIGGVISYHLQVDDNFVFSGPEIDLTFGPATSEYEATELEEGARYFWRVQSLYYVGLIPTWSAWSTEWNFTTLVSTPTLASPANGATGVCHPVVLDWHPVPGATQYKYMVGDSPDFIGSNQGGDVFYDTTETLDIFPLEENKQYWWKIRAKVDDVFYDWSDAWTFTTNPFSSGPPSLVSPADGAVDLTVPVQLDWTSVTDAMNYRIQVADDNTFAAPIVDMYLIDTFYSATSLVDGETYFWRVRVQDDCGAWSDYTPTRHFTMSGGSAVDNDDHPVASIFSLSQNHPNPFNPSTIIEYTIPSRTHVRLDIFNLLGEHVITLADETKSAGTYLVTWAGVDRNGHAAASGIYVYRLQADDIVQSKKMVLMK